jgi:hypothetical protein
MVDTAIPIAATATTDGPRFALSAAVVMEPRADIFLVLLLDWMDDQENSGRWMSKTDHKRTEPNQLGVWRTRAAGECW